MGNTCASGGPALCGLGGTAHPASAPATADGSAQRKRRGEAPSARLIPSTERPHHHHHLPQPAQQIQQQQQQVDGDGASRLRQQEQQQEEQVVAARAASTTAGDVPVSTRSLRVNRGHETSFVNGDGPVGKCGSDEHGAGRERGGHGRCAGCV